MSVEQPPLILVSNDDGIDSPGLQALVEAVQPLGEVLVVAPKSPYSSAGRSLIWGSRTIEPRHWPLPGVTAYAVDGAPALTVRVGLSVLASRPPALVLSGINYGENLGTDVTGSGTVGAAMEAAIEGILGVAFSLEAPPEYHDSPRPGLDFGPTAAFARRLVSSLLQGGLPAEIDLLNVNVPASAGPTTPWRVTRLSRQMYWQAVIRQGPDGTKMIAGYERRIDWATLEPDSDIYAFVREGAISISPMTMDLSAPSAMAHLQPFLEARLANHVLRG